MAVAIDQPVSDFHIPATGEQTVSLSGLKGKHVVIYFYPKDSTPGCTTEGQGFRDPRQTDALSGPAVERPVLPGQPR